MQKGLGLWYSAPKKNQHGRCQDEDVPTDLWQKGYRLAKAFDRGGVPLTRAAVEDKDRWDSGRIANE